MISLSNIKNIITPFVLFHSLMVLVAPIAIILTQFVPKQWSPLLASTNTLVVTTVGILLPTGFGIYYTNNNRLSLLVLDIAKKVHFMLNKDNMLSSKNNVDDEDVILTVKTVYKALRRSIHEGYFRNRFRNIFSESKRYNEFVYELTKYPNYITFDNIATPKDIAYLEDKLTNIYNVHPGAVFVAVKSILITLLYITFASSVTVDIDIKSDNFVYYWLGMQFTISITMFVSIRSLEIAATLFAGNDFVY